MAYVPHVAHDIFVSYAHLDNLAPGGKTGGGWVDSFVEPLTLQLKKRLGSSAVDIWIDRQLPGNRPLTPEILTAVRDSALLLVVMSPSYVNSYWCGRERNAFLELARDRVAAGRIFIVKSLDVPQTDRPLEFGDLIGYPFFVTDSDTGVPRSLGDLDPGEPAFLKQIYNLSYHLANELTRLTALADAPAVVPEAAVSDSPRVFVARATDDLEDREEELRNYLTQAGISVSPRRQYMQADATAFEAAVRADLDSSKLFIQLLSTARGAEAPFDGAKRLPLLQWEIAQRIGTKILLWRDRGIDPSATTHAEHRKLLESAIACPIEEFKRAVADEARRHPPPAPARPSGVMVFVNSDSRDQALALQLGNALAGEGVACYWPLDKGSPEEVRKDLEANLRDCDGVLIVYGSSEPYWVREQLRFGMKVFSSQRSSRPALGVFQGPPPDKTKLGLLDPEMIFLDCSGGFDTASLRPFVSRLRA
jgi:TIR domain